MVNALLKISVGIILIFLVACSAQKKLENSNYEKAFKKSIAALEKDKNIKTNKATLSKALNEIYIDRVNFYKTLNNESDFEDWEIAYDQLVDLSKKIWQSSVYLNDEYATEQEIIDDLKLNLGEILTETYIETAGKWMKDFDNSDRKIYARNAHQLYEKAQIISGSKYGLDTLESNSLKAARTVYYIESKFPYDPQFKWHADRKFDFFEGYGNKYFKVLYEETTFEADCDLQIVFLYRDLQSQVTPYAEQFQNTVITGYETQTNPDGTSVEVPIQQILTGSVSAQIIDYVAIWDVEVNTRKNNKSCNSEPITFRSQISDRVFTNLVLTGETEAIPPELRNIQNQIAPTEQEIFEWLVEDAIDSVVRIYFN